MNASHRRTRSGPAVALSLAAAVIALSGCTAAGSDAAAGDAPDEQTATIALADAVECLDPHQTPQTPPLHVARQLVANLTDQDPDTGEIVPWLASSWEVNDDATAFTFTLRDGVTYSDGAPVDAASVVANLDDIAQLGARSPLGAGYLAGFAGAEAINDTTVEVRFDEPSAQFLQATSMVTLGLLSPATIALDAEERCAGQLSGSGPFTIESQVQNESVTLAARKDYAWGSALSEHDGAPALDRLVFTIVVDGSSRNGNFTSGAIDVDTQVLPQNEPTLGDELLSGTRPGIVYTFLPNESRGVFADAAVRRALSLAIDREALTPLLSRGERPATDVVASTTPGYTDRSAELRHDPEQAAALLDAAGWTGASGVRTRDGQPLSVELVYSANERYSSVYEEIARQVAEVGIDLVLSNLDASANSARQDAGDYDLVSWAVTRADPSILASIYPVASANPLKRSTADGLDVSIASIASSLDATTRQAAVDTAALEILDQAHGIPLFEQAASVAVSDRLSGVRLDASARPLFADAQVRS